MRRKQYSMEFKSQIIHESLDTGNSALVARRHGLNTNMVARWVREYKQGKHQNGSEHGLPPIDTDKITTENEQLKKLLGQKDLEIEILQDLIKKKNPHLLKKLK